MKEKYTYILFIVGIILSLVVFLALFFMSFSQNETGTLPTPTPVPLLASPTPIVIPFNKPKQANIVVDDISVKNFYKQGRVFDTNGDVSIQKNRQYEIVYLAPFEEFIIEILGTPFETIRADAESAFLLQLGITQEAACKLKVSIGTPATSNPTQSGTKTTLSFCQNQ